MLAANMVSSTPQEVPSALLRRTAAGSTVPGREARAKRAGLRARRKSRRARYGIWVNASALATGFSISYPVCALMGRPQRAWWA